LLSKYKGRDIINIMEEYNSVGIKIAGVLYYAPL